MKKSLYIIIFLIITISSCLLSFKSDTTTTMSETDASKSAIDEVKFFSAITDEAFYEKVFSNPIDLTDDIFINESITASEILSYNEYRKQWEGQMQQTLCVLKAELTEAEYQKLLLSQSAWEEYMTATSTLEQNLYYLDGVVGNGMSYPMTSLVRADRTRARTLELMSFEFLLTNDIQFVEKADLEGHNERWCIRASDNFFVVTQEEEFYHQIAQISSTNNSAQKEYWVAIKNQALEGLEKGLVVSDYELLVQADTAWKEYINLTNIIEHSLLRDDDNLIEQLYVDRLKAEAVTVLSYKFSIESEDWHIA